MEKPEYPIPKGDFVLFDQGQLSRLMPLSEAAKEWCVAQLERAEKPLSRSYLISPAKMEPILSQILKSGLSVEAMD